MSGVRDDQLDHPTPCPDWTVADLLAHVHQFATVYTHNARKRQARPPEDLVDDWRVAIPDQLDELARAWRVDSAWQGRVSAGGVEMDAQDNAVVGIEELTMHGWDLAGPRARTSTSTMPAWTTWTNSSSCSPSRSPMVMGRSARRQVRPSLRRGSSASSHVRAANRPGRQPDDHSHRRICRQHLISFRWAGHRPRPVIESLAATS